MQLPELLAPAGSFEKLEAALLYGANAVYLGGKSGNLRAGCEGFTPEETARAVALAEANKAKIYYCLNSFPFESDLAALPKQIEDAAQCGVHAFIAADPGVLRLIQKYAPGVEIHLSTQANTTNSEAVAFWLEAGASRVNLARELSWAEVHALRRSLPQAELEIFVHGAMCLALSGQCLMSAWLNDRPANQGRCTHPCRYEYGNARLSGVTLEERTRAGEPLWTAGCAEGFSAVYAPHDLCLLPYLPHLCALGTNSLKIEGRMKGAGYVAQVVDVYRTALNTLTAEEVPSLEKTPGRPEKTPELKRRIAELASTASRPLSSGFFLPERNIFAEPAVERPLLAKVLEPAGRGPLAGVWRCEVRGPWKRGTDVEILAPGMKRPLLVGGSYGLENSRGELANSVGSGAIALLYADSADLAPGLFLRGA